MRYLLLILIFSIFLLPATAQEEAQSPYEIALQRIEEARVSGTDVVSFAFSGLTELPPEIGNLHNLRRLYLNNNQLTSLPHEIGNLENLVLLYLEHNQLTELPSEIGNLRSLGALYLEHNRLQSLPNEMGNLQSLCILHFRYNEIRYLPTSLGYLENLKSYGCGIVVGENPLVYPPQEILALGQDGLLDYLRNEAWWYMRKLIAGGAGAVGIVAAAILGIRWRTRRRYEKKKKG